MKKLISFLLCINLLSLPALCEIKDDFAESSLSKNLSVTKYQQVNINDDFAEKSLDKNLKVKDFSYKPVIDSFAENNKAKNYSTDKRVSFEESIPSVTHKNVKKCVIIDETASTKVRVKISEFFTTKNKAEEGTFVGFETLEDVKLGNKIYPKGSFVNARVETISQNAALGVPADLIIGNFSLDGIPLSGEINKVGANRSLWVYPSVYALAILFFGSGLLLIPIRGGHAKISPSETFTLYAK